MYKPVKHCHIVWNENFQTLLGFEDTLPTTTGDVRTVQPIRDDDVHRGSPTGKKVKAYQDALEGRVHLAAPCSR